MRLVKERLMPDRASKQPETVPGRWYTDTSCDLARFVSMKHSDVSEYKDDETDVYFFKGAETSEETAVARRAFDVCPTLSIGNDG